VARGPQNGSVQRRRFGDGRLGDEMCFPLECH